MRWARLGHWTEAVRIVFLTSGARATEKALRPRRSYIGKTNLEFHICRPLSANSAMVHRMRQGSDGPCGP
jgi:hypothetical protein